METPTNCVADNNSANLAFMAIATKRGNLELQDESFTLKLVTHELVYCRDCRSCNVLELWILFWARDTAVYHRSWITSRIPSPG